MYRIVSAYLFTCLFAFPLLAGNVNELTAKLNKGGIKFTENKGQVHDQNYEARPDVLFSGEANGMVFHLRKDGVSYQLYKRTSVTPLPSYPLTPMEGVKGEKGKSLNSDSMAIHRIDINWIDANKDFEIEYGEALEDYNNYYLAVCPDGVTGVKSYKDITFKNVWDGIDIKWYEKNGHLEYDFVLSPEANIKLIKCKVSGSDVHQEKEGLFFKTGLGTIRTDPPVAFQNNKPIKVKREIERNVITFSSRKYNTSEELIIDPLVRVFGTYFGGSANDNVWCMDKDNGNSIFIGGSTSSTSSIATSGAHQTTLIGTTDAFIAKFNFGGSLSWATYYGGSGGEVLYSMACGNNGWVYGTGSTNSTSSIATIGVHQTNYGGSGDAMILCLNGSGIRQWSTYFGGSDLENSRGIAVDDSLRVYVCGGTKSTTDIATSNAHQATHSYALNFDAFIVKFDNLGQRLWATYYGDFYDDGGQSCKVDKNNNPYILGYTSSFYNIATTGSFQMNHAGSTDMFLVKFNSAGQRQFGTYIGGSQSDVARMMDIDQHCNIYALGHTYSTSGVTTTGAFQTTYGGNRDALLVKFDSNGTRLWSTYFGGSSMDNIFNCSVSDTNGIYIGGSTDGGGLATLGSYQNSVIGSEDAIIARFGPGGTRLWSTYYGGVNSEYLYALHANENGVIFAGKTASDSNMASPLSYQQNYNGGGDAFLVRLKNCVVNQVNIQEMVCDSMISPSGKYWWYSSGIYNDTLLNHEGCDSIITINLTITPTPTISPGWIEGRCDPGSLNLPVNTTGGVVYWYDSISSTQHLDSGLNFQTPFLDSTATFYAEATENGCVSIRIAVQAFIWYSDSTEFDTTTCITYTAPDSTTLNTTGIHIIKLQNQSGCDSVFTIDLTVIPVNKKVSILNSTLTSKADSANYQWIDCSTNNLISNETNQSFTASSNGSYAVIVTKNGCTDTSDCVDVTWVGINKLNSENISVFPNPTNNILNIDLGQVSSKSTFILRNDLGQIVLEEEVYNQQKVSLDLSKFSDGIYSLSIQAKDGISTHNVVKQAN